MGRRQWPRLLCAFAAVASITSRAQTVFPSAIEHLQIAGTEFRAPSGKPFQWRGITAFRLVEMVAHGQRAEAAAFLDWTASRKLTVVRVFTMARALFELRPADGVRALPELLQMAAARGLHVEVVGLVDTAALQPDLAAHVKALGDIAARNPNALLEIANEPAHPTQSAEVHDPAELRRLAAFVPAVVPVSLGSAEENNAYAAGRYATYHFPRSGGATPWGHVLRLANGAALIKAWNRPVVSDEPIGAAAAAVPGRRDNDPDRFRAAALLTRMAGMGATFHYERGLQARIPTGQELRCFDAWNEAWTLLPANIETEGEFFEAGVPGAAVSSFDRGAATAVFERQNAAFAHVVVIGAHADPGIKWGEGWSLSRTVRSGTVSVIIARRVPRGSRPR
jgi:hypothetical protein